MHTAAYKADGAETPLFYHRMQKNFCLVKMPMNGQAVTKRNGIAHNKGGNFDGLIIKFR